MELTSTQRYALSQMGIPIWELRINESDTLSQFVSEEETAFDASTRYWLVSAATNLSIDEQRLLTAMLRAIGLDHQMTALITPAQLTGFQSDVLVNKQILMFGQGLVKELSENMTETYSLQQLLADNRLKSHAWQSLKLFKSAS